MYARDGLRTLCFTRKVKYVSFHLHYRLSMGLSMSRLSVTVYDVIRVTSPVGIFKIQITTHVHDPLKFFTLLLLFGFGLVYYILQM